MIRLVVAVATGFVVFVVTFALATFSAVDLRAWPEPHTTHRAVLGMGIHRAHRRRGLGGRMIEHALRWARDESQIDWVDLEVLGTNAPAKRLYERLGFETLATIGDMYRVDGESVCSVLMTRRIERALRDRRER